MKGENSICRPPPTCAPTTAAAAAAEQLATLKDSTSLRRRRSIFRTDINRPFCSSHACIHIWMHRVADIISSCCRFTRYQNVDEELHFEWWWRAALCLPDVDAALQDIAVTQRSRYQAVTFIRTTIEELTRHMHVWKASIIHPHGGGREQESVRQHWEKLTLFFQTHMNEVKFSLNPQLVDTKGAPVTSGGGWVERSERQGASL